MAIAQRLAVLLVLVATACAGPSQRSTENFGQTAESAPAPPLAAEAAPPGSQLAMSATPPGVPAGFRAVALASGINGPAAIAADDVGDVFLIEGGNRLMRLGQDGGRDLVTQGAEGVVWTGVASTGALLFVTVQGAAEGGQLLRVDLDGRTSVLVSGLPVGEHSIDAPRIGPDGLVYVGVGTVTRAGTVEKDAPWRSAAPGAHDIPCQDVRLNGRNLRQDHTQTGAFLPFGTAAKPGQVIPGQVPCTGAVLRTSQNGGPVQLVAWGFEDPHSLAFTPDGRLYLVDGGDQTAAPGGPGGAIGSQLFAVAPGVWYGWPDVPPRRQAATVLAAQPNPPPPALARFPEGVKATSFDVARADLFGGPVQAYVGLAESGRAARVVRINLHDGSVADFAELPVGGRVQAMQFSPDGESLYLLDQAGTLWRIGRDIPIG